MTELSDFEYNLSWLGNWWDQTTNPVYAWRAMHLCFVHQAPLPEWVLGYFRKASSNMAALGLGHDFRKTEWHEIDPDQAKALVGEALDLWRSKSKNMFARVVDDAHAQRAAMAVDRATQRSKGGKVIFYAENGVVREAPTAGEAKRELLNSVQDDRAGRILKNGRALNRAKPPPPGR